MNDPTSEPKPQVGIPRWLVWAFIGKMVAVTAITAVVIWIAYR